MFLEPTPEQREFQQLADQFARDHVAAQAAHIDETGEYPRALMQQAGAPRPAGRHHRPRVGRGRPRLRVLRAGARGAGARQCDGRRHRGGEQLAGGRAAREVRDRRAEARLAAAAGLRPVAGRVRAVGGVGRNRRRQPADARHVRRHAPPPHRAQGVGRQRGGRRPRHRVRVDAARHRRPRDHRLPRADGLARHHAPRPRRLARRARDWGASTSSSTTSASTRARCSGRRAVGSRLRAGRSTAGGWPSRPRRSASARRPWTRRSPTRSSGRPSGRPSRTTRPSSGCWRTWRPIWRRPAC